jgi:hypothetical protein
MKDSHARLPFFPLALLAFATAFSALAMVLVVEGSRLWARWSVEMVGVEEVAR